MFAAQARWVLRGGRHSEGRKAKRRLCTSLFAFRPSLCGLSFSTWVLVLQTPLIRYHQAITYCCLLIAIQISHGNSILQSVLYSNKFWLSVQKLENQYSLISRRGKHNGENGWTQWCMSLQNMPTASCCVSTTYLQSRKLMKHYEIDSLDKTLCHIACQVEC